MKEGMPLQQLAAEVRDIASRKVDYLFPSQQMRFYATPAGCTIELGDRDRLRVSPHFNEQMADYLDIPSKYYERMRSTHPGLLAYNVNGWLQQKPSGDRRLIRVLRSKPDERQGYETDTYGGTARALLGDRYRPIDNEDLLTMLLPVLDGRDDLGLRIESCNISDDNLYIKAITARRAAPIPGDFVNAGVIVANGETGERSIFIAPFIKIRSCSNGAAYEKHGIRKYHTGKYLEATATYNVFKDDTREAQDKAFLLTCRDLVRSALEDEVFQKIVNDIRIAQGVPIENPAATIEVLSNRYSMSTDESDDILKYLAEGGDISMWGLSQAVTRMSQDVPEYDRATELEFLGGALSSMSLKDAMEFASADLNRKRRQKRALVAASVTSAMNGA